MTISATLGPRTAPATSWNARRSSGDFRRDDQLEVAFDLVSAAGARALGIGDYGITVGGAANLLHDRRQLCR
jgi:cytosine/adenosine deaminase-related metal-dependent hydrolase